MDLNKTLSNLELPDYLGSFDGLIYKQLSKSFHLEITYDFTKKVIDPITKKSSATITKKLVFQEKESPTLSKIYALNWINFRFNNNRFAQIELDELTGNAKFEHGLEQVVLELGPKAGETVWYNAVSAEFIDSLDAEKHIKIKTSLGVNSIDGITTDVINPLVSLKTVQKIITGTVKTTVSVNRTTGERTFNTVVTNIKELVKNVKNTNLYLNEIKELTGLTEQELMDLNSTTYFITPAPSDNHITNTSVEAVFTPDGDDLIADAVVYYNGISTDVKRPSGMITSYDKQYPGHVVRWKLYDGVVNESIYGSSATIQFNSLQDDKIRIVAGNETKYDAVNKVLTFNVEDGATLWCSFEESPAQGKNWSNEAIYYLSEGSLPVRI